MKTMGINHRGGLALIRGTWASWLQYRSFFFLLAFAWMIQPLLSLFIWSAAAGEGSLGGIDRAGFITYYLLVIFVNQVTYAQANYTLGDVIRSGGITTWLLRPVPALYHVFSSEVAGKVVYTLFTVPVVLLLGLVLKPDLSLKASSLPGFVLALALAWALRNFWGIWLALLAFWSTRADALLTVQDSLVFLLSGVLAPVALLPGAMQTAARWLPFHAMIGFPVEVMMGHLTPAETVQGFAFQVGWLAVSLALTRVMWNRGVRRYSAVGG